MGGKSVKEKGLDTFDGVYEEKQVPYWARGDVYEDE